MADYKKRSEQEIVLALGALEYELNGAQHSLKEFEARLKLKEAAGASASPTGITIGPDIEGTKQAVQNGIQAISSVVKEVQSALHISPVLGGQRLAK